MGAPAKRQDRPKIPAAIRNEIARLEASVTSAWTPARRAYASGALAMARWCLTARARRPSEILLAVTDEPA
jgi:hypothetical protein